jgi:hypothetical protein
VPGVWWSMEGKEPDGTGAATPANSKPADATPFAAPWESTGPTKATGNYLIIDRLGVCRATVKVTPRTLTEPGNEAEAWQTCRLIVRAPSMRVLLEHVRDELLRDDEGVRFGNEIKLINEELERTGARIS